MASGDSLVTWGPYENEPPATLYAIEDTRNTHPALNFDSTTAWYANFSDILPRNYAGGGITVYITWAAATATSGTIGWTVAFERIGSATQDIDSDGFATAQTITAATVNGSSGIPTTTTVAVSNGANIDNIAGGDLFRLQVMRDVNNDNAAGYAQLLAVELKET